MISSVKCWIGVHEGTWKKLRGSVTCGLENVFSTGDGHHTRTEVSWTYLPATVERHISTPLSWFTCSFLFICLFFLFMYLITICQAHPLCSVEYPSEYWWLISDTLNHVNCVEEFRKVAGRQAVSQSPNRESYQEILELEAETLATIQ
jgi:hypothetical protein